MIYFGLFIGLELLEFSQNFLLLFLVCGLLFELFWDLLLE